MLISCPKCHSIYEIPDDLIPRTGQNFRCQACANVWHAMRQDAIGYEPETNEEPYIEAIPVSEPPHRNYPANKTSFKVPADGKSGRKTRSSQEIILKECDSDYIPPAPKIKRKKEITLTSDMGTSFTISAAPFEEEEKVSFFEKPENKELTANAKERLQLEKPFKGYKKTTALLFFVIFMAVLGFLRREITTVFPSTEKYYNQIGLSGWNNPEYLSFKNIDISQTNVENKPMIKITAHIYNDSFYTTHVPNVSLSDIKETFAPNRLILRGHEQTTVEILLPRNQNTKATSLTLSFVKP